MQRPLAVFMFALVFGFGGIHWGQDAITAGALSVKRRMRIEKAAQISAEGGLTMENKLFSPAMLLILPCKTRKSTWIYGSKSAG